MMRLKHLAPALGLALGALASAQAQDPASAHTAAGQGKKPNTVIFWGDDIRVPIYPSENK